MSIDSGYILTFHSIGNNKSVKKFPEFLSSTIFNSRDHTAQTSQI